MPNSVRYVIEDSGRVYRQTINEQEIDIDQNIMARYAKEQIVKTYNLFSPSIISPKLCGNVGMATCGKVVAFTIQLGALPLRARFTVEGGKLVPEFTASSTPMNLEWIPPGDMILMMMIIMQADMTASAEQYIVALDMSHRMYRIPTTNMHDNCQLCTGKYDGYGSSYADAIGKALNQFVASDWGSHLPGTKEQMAASKKLFRFKPLEPEGFEQLPYDAENWTHLCTKVSVEPLNRYLVV